MVLNVNSTARGSDPPSLLGTLGSNGSETPLPVDVVEIVPIDHDHATFFQRRQRRLRLAGQIGQHANHKRQLHVRHDAEVSTANAIDIRGVARG